MVLKARRMCKPQFVEGGQNTIDQYGKGRIIHEHHRWGQLAVRLCDVPMGWQMLIKREGIPFSKPVIMAAAMALGGAVHFWA